MICEHRNNWYTLSRAAVQRDNGLARLNMHMSTKRLLKAG